MKVLFISDYVPYRANSGTKVALYNSLSCISRICDVTCVYLCEDEREAEIAKRNEDFSVKNHAILIDRKFNPIIRYINHLMNLLFVRKNIKNELSCLIGSESPEIIWLEPGYICQLIPFLRGFNIPIFYRSHNSQFKLDYNIWKANSIILSKLKMAPFMPIYMVQERLFLKLADKILCISQQDFEYYKNFIPESKLKILPCFFDENRLANNDLLKLPKRYICIVGSMYSYQNYSAVIYSLENLWPIIHKKDRGLYLYIVGKLPPEKSVEFRRLKENVDNSNNVVLTGEVDDVIPYVKRAIVNIVPILIGSGVRTKIIESVACKTPVVSTSVGAEGLPFLDGESIYIADDKELFSEKVMKLLNNSSERARLIENASRVYRQELSLDAGIKKFRNLLFNFHLKAKN